MVLESLLLFLLTGQLLLYCRWRRPIVVVVRGPDDWLFVVVALVVVCGTCSRLSYFGASRGALLLVDICCAAARGFVISLSVRGRISAESVGRLQDFLLCPLGQFVIEKYEWLHTPTQIIHGFHVLTFCQMCLI